MTKELAGIFVAYAAHRASTNDRQRVYGIVIETYLVLNEQLDTLDGGSGSLRDGGRDTTHCSIPLAMFLYPAMLLPAGIKLNAHRWRHCDVIQCLVEVNVLRKSTMKGW